MQPLISKQYSSTFTTSKQQLFYHTCHLQAKSYLFPAPVLSFVIPRVPLIYHNQMLNQVTQLAPYLFSFILFAPDHTTLPTSPHLFCSHKYLVIHFDFSETYSFLVLSNVVYVIHLSLSISTMLVLSDSVSSFCTTKARPNFYNTPST